MAEQRAQPPMRAVGMVLAAAPLALGGCATMAAGPHAGRVADTCRAQPGQPFIGQRATAETGAAIMEATRSTSLRWIPPEMIVTTEYAFGRATIAYDADYRITEVSCG